MATPLLVCKVGPNDEAAIAQVLIRAFDFEWKFVKSVKSF